MNISIPRRVLVVGVTVIAGAVLPTLSATSTSADTGAVRARATIIDATGNQIGFAHFTEDASGGVHVNVKVADLSPGQHGLHVHRVGLCETSAFTSAGGHFDPSGASHGSHAGDLPNLVVNDAGRGTLNTHVDGFTLSAGEMSLFDVDGSAIVIHANPDDFTPPTGNSGARVACGVLTAS
jgi:superoxide dismutase, Cu-Zn family